MAMQTKRMVTDLAYDSMGIGGRVDFFAVVVVVGGFWSFGFVSVVLSAMVYIPLK